MPSLPSGISRACWTTAFLLFFPLAVAAEIITEVNVRHLDVEMQDDGFVLSRVGVKPGDRLDRQAISRDVNALLATGRFGFVNAELTPGPDGHALTYVVAARPILGRPVEVSGAESAGPRRVTDWLDLRAGDTVDEAILAVRAQNIEEEYGKRFRPDAKVVPSISVDPATGFATAHIDIEEGERLSLRRVRFEGNTYVPPGRLRRLVAGLTGLEPEAKESVPPAVLRRAVRDQVWHLFSFITRRGRYDPYELSTRRHALRAIYQDNGYLDARVSEPEVRAYRRNRLEAVFTIDEGEQYRVGAVSIEGAELFAEPELSGLIGLEPGDIASMRAIRNATAGLLDHYQSRGYLRTTVTHVLSPHETDPEVDVRFDIEEGRPVNIRYIDIRGNTRTKDSVIRRELLVYPGQVYDRSRVERSERILQNLGFFSSVASYPRETPDPASDDLVFEVEEQKTGQFMMGAGFSSVDDFVGFVELSQGNFDLFGWPRFTGAGQKLRARAQLGTKRQDYEISFVEPWLFGRRLSFGVDLYDTTLKYLSRYYDQERLGGAVTLGTPVRGFFHRADLRYSLDSINIYNVSPDAITRVRDEAGRRKAAALRLTATHDTRDSVFVPSAGNRITLAGRLAGGPLGFDTDIYGFEAESTSYFSPWLNHVLGLRLWAAVVEEYGSTGDVPLYDRLYLGGARWMRGFKFRHVGPYEEGEPIGGKTAAMACVEYTVPIPALRIVRLAGFYELGNAWLDAYDFNLPDYNSDVGIGLRLDIPGFPVRLDYAWPLEITGDVERTPARFNFMLGYGF